jgi:hypothetical protein
MYETKVILMALANQAVLAKNKKQVFELIRSAAQVEGLTIPEYEVVKAALLGEDSDEED